MMGGFQPHNCYWCQKCDVRWPMMAQYDDCPKCSRTTLAAYGAPVLSSIEAYRIVEEHKRSKALYDRFEREYDETKEHARTEALVAQVMAGVDAEWAAAGPAITAGEWAHKPGKLGT